MIDSSREQDMAKGYWISAHRRPADPDKHAAYRAITIDAIKAAGGKFLVIGGRSEAREYGLEQRSVVIEFESYDLALAAYETEDYKRALAALGDGAERDIRIIEGA
jgi:uncharacterized protein (DUF1330 family)